MNYLFDNNLPPRISRAINELDNNNEIIHLREKFKSDTEDIAWIKKLGEEKDWIVITADNQINKNPYEKKVWQETNLKIIFLAKGWITLKLWEKAWKLIKSWPAITQTIDKRNNNSGYTVSISGKIESI